MNIPTPFEVDQLNKVREIAATEFEIKHAVDVLVKKMVEQPWEKQFRQLILRKDVADVIKQKFEAQGWAVRIETKHYPNYGNPYDLHDVYVERP